MDSILEQTGVKIDSTFTPMLEELQAGVLEHHGREFAFHLLVGVRDTVVARAWISDFAGSRITTSLKQLTDIKKRADDCGYDGGTVLSLSLTAKGYQKLNVPIERVPNDEAFREGMKRRSKRLRDNPATFEDYWEQDIHLLIILADSNEAVVKKNVNSISNQIIKWGSIVHLQPGRVLRNKAGVGIEHFNYADGVSQPLFTERSITKQKQREFWNDKAKLSILLKKDSGSNKEASFGSYLVFRKLEQDIRAFKTAEKKIKEVRQENGDENDELAGAMIVGRFESGTEVINSSTETEIEKDTDLNNDFDYSTDPHGLKCPLHAHIRMTNPRRSEGAGDVSSHRIARRGIPYSADKERTPDEIESENPGEHPSEGYGLLFMCYQSSIPNGFEFIQHFWANNGEIGNKLVGQDGIIGQGPNNTKRFLPAQWGQSEIQSEPLHFGNFVTLKGGEYFFTPSISFLRNL